METQTLPRSEHYPVPEHTMGALERYVFQRLQPGSFLTAVLSNDLFDALGRADTFNKAAIADICGYIYNHVPSTCWGSRAKVDAWLYPNKEADDDQQ